MTRCPACGSLMSYHPGDEIAQYWCRCSMLYTDEYLKGLTEEQAQAIMQGAKSKKGFDMSKEMSKIKRIAKSIQKKQIQHTFVDFEEVDK